MFNLCLVVQVNVSFITFSNDIVIVFYRINEFVDGDALVTLFKVENTSNMFKVNIKT